MADISTLSNLRLPSLPDDRPLTAEDTRKLKSYLYQLNEQLQYLLSHIDEENLTSSVTERLGAMLTSAALDRRIEIEQAAARKRLSEAAASIRGYTGGHLRETTGTDGKANGFLLMDTDDAQTAQRALWFNLAGICYQDVSGTAGAHISQSLDDYDTVWSFEKSGFYADWIVAGTLSAALVSTGILQSSDGGETFYLDLDNGVLRMNAQSLTLAGGAVLTQTDMEDGTALTQSGVFNALTANGTTQGLLLEDGKLYVSGEAIRGNTSVYNEKYMEFSSAVAPGATLPSTRVRAALENCGLWLDASQIGTLGGLYAKDVGGLRGVESVLDVNTACIGEAEVNTRLVAGSSTHTAESEALSVKNSATVEGGLTVKGKASFGQGIYGQILELTAPTPFIDFHAQNSTADYTSRLIAEKAGVLNCTGSFAANGLTTRGTGTNAAITYMNAQSAVLAVNAGAGMCSVTLDQTPGAGEILHCVVTNGDWAAQPGMQCSAAVRAGTNIVSINYSGATAGSARFNLLVFGTLPYSG